MSVIKKSEKGRSKLWIRYISKFVSIVSVLVACLTALGKKICENKGKYYATLVNVIIILIILTIIPTTISATVESDVAANLTHELLLPPGDTHVSTTGEPKVTTTNPCEHGFIDFEEGTDRAVIYSTIHGVKFTTTAGQDWIYGDWRTGNYNGPYPNGAYTSNGNFFAWLGENQGYGRIDFTEGNATYLSLLTSTYSGVTIDAYDSDDNLLASSSWAGNNINTGEMTRLIVNAPGMAYVIIHDTGNYWLIDDICTDAGGVRGVNLDISTDKIAYSPTEMVNISAKVTDAYGSCLYPLHKDSFTVYVDGIEVNIEGFKELSCTEYKLAIKAPQIVGDHTIGVNVDTAPGREYDSTAIKVYTIGNVYLSVEGNRLTQYENSADTPIYRRNDDETIPDFNMEVEIIGVTQSEFSEVEDNVRVFVSISDYKKVKEPVILEADAIACGLGNSILYNAKWKSPDDFPVGKYNVTAEVRLKNVGIDTATNVSNVLDCLNNKGILFIGRYFAAKYTWKVLSRYEAQKISDAGMYIISIWQESANYPEYFSYNQGKSDGKNAFEDAADISQTHHTPVYFAVDFDATQSYKQNILNYFEGVRDGYKEYLSERRQNGLPEIPYKIGVYGSYDVLTWCEDQGIATYFFQAHMLLNGVVAETLIHGVVIICGRFLRNKKYVTLT